MDSKLLKGPPAALPAPITQAKTSANSRSRDRSVLLAIVLCGLFLLHFNRWPFYSWHFNSRHGLSVSSSTGNPAVLVRAQHGAVATENERCSKIGVDVLKDGGNAVDAAIASVFCIGVVNISGLGGGGFMTVRIPPSKHNGSVEAVTIDFREVGPAASNATMFHDHPELSRFGGLSVAVPGEVRGMEEAHGRWGSLPWKRLLQPSIELASGWKVDRELGKRIPWFADLMLNNSDWAAIFAPDGRLLREGEIIRRTSYSRTLALVAEHGGNAFYKGPIADAMVAKVQSEGGILTHEDLESYSVKVRPALRGTYRGKTVYTTHAPTSGPVLLYMLNLMENYDMEERSTLSVHRLVEILKFGFAARTKICDLDFTDDLERITEIPTKEFAASTFLNITDDRTHPPEYYHPVYDLPSDHGTSHTSTIDKNGMSVSVTSTINFVFGSQVLDPITGIIFNDEMDDFSVPGVPNGFGLWPSPYNYPEAGKRSLSSTAASIIDNQDGSFYASIGGSGGSRIFGSIFQVLMNLEWDLDISKAIEYGRVHDQLYPLTMEVDDTYPADIIDGLRALGHNVTVEHVTRVAAAIQGIVKVDDVIYAASDSRKNGIAAGY
ncbi:gamma-glutamyltranspeptidase [Fistulina hepatica ATCC 64428]|uniref:Glutathione hydrolase n=1 Tax=Fistulina hepatica ATCC 64428 TaxID=1128425 RepID=A0A0D7AP65_9AGAR|nr:gamma-glutamyltranspeptidase [Fistulina hepatica ATCC 64428]